MAQGTIGSKNQLIQSIVFEDDSDENPKGTIVYIQTGSLADVKDKAPKIGSKSGYFPTNCLLQHRNFSFSPEGSGAVTVTLTYSPNEDGTDGLDEDNENAAASYEMIVGIGTASLAEHESLTEYQKVIVKALLDGLSPAEYCAIKTVDGALTILRLGDYPDDDRVKELQAAGFELGPVQALIKTNLGSGDGAKIVEKVMQGSTTFDVAAATFRRTTYGGSIESVLKKIGKKGNPIGAPSGEWLYLGASCSKSSTERQWRITEEWKLGSNGELDSSIYKQGEE